MGMMGSGQHSVRAKHAGALGGAGSGYRLQVQQAKGQGAIQEPTYSGNCQVP